jgi:hypothetical protein
LSSGQKIDTFHLSENRRYRCLYHPGLVLGKLQVYR